LLAAAVLSLGPVRLRPYTGVPHDIEHALAFALLGLPFGFGFPRRWLALSLAAIAIAAGLEALQLLRPGRHAYLTDVFINAGGACVGIWLGAVLSRLWDRRGGR
jgi:VanZ family protein